MMTAIPSERKRKRSAMVWILPLLAGVLLLIGLWIGIGFYRHYKASEGAPKLSDVVRILEVLPGVRAKRIQEIIEGETWEKMAPRVRVVLFTFTLLGVLVWATIILFYEYLFYFVTRGEHRNRFAPYVWLRRTVLGVAGVGVLCLLYGFFIEPNWLEVTHLRIETPKLPHGAQIRIVQISDLHMARTVRLEPRVMREMAEEKPDVIIFCGDAMNSSWVLGRFKQFLLEATQIAPVYLVKGNQDEGIAWDPRDIYRGTNTHELTGQVETLQVRGTELWIRGMANLQSYKNLPRILPPEKQFSIFVYHTPDEILEVARDGYDLYLCGHTHGGQVALPFYGALITFSKFDKKYEAGLYHEGGTTMYVNRGIGMAKWPQPEVRFLARPELTVIDLVGQ
jgi:predicted MPP superfamily phosphohydrolase